MHSNNVASLALTIIRSKKAFISGRAYLSSPLVVKARVGTVWSAVGRRVEHHAELVQCLWLLLSSGLAEVPAKRDDEITRHDEEF